MLAEGVISKELTSAAKRAIAENPDKLQTGSRNPFGMRPELTNLINASKFTPVLNSLIGAFDPPITTHVGILPVAKTPPSEKDMPCANASPCSLPVAPADDEPSRAGTSTPACTWTGSRRPASSTTRRPTRP